MGGNGLVRNGKMEGNGLVCRLI